MTTEQAILSLSKRAEYAQLKADTPDKQRKARDYVEAVNRIIDFYNKNEAVQEERQNLLGIVQVLCEYIGIRQSDIDVLKQTDAKYMRRQLSLWLPDWGDLPHWLFHHVALDSEILQNKKISLHDCKNLYIPLLDRLAAGERQTHYSGNLCHSPRMDLLEHMMQQQSALESEIAAETDYA